MENDKMKCHICENFYHGIGRCKFCHFDFDEGLPWTDDSQWDIFEMDDDTEWSHLQLQYRLKSKGIDCLSADIWFDNNMAYILGPKADKYRIARALGIHEEVIYDDFERGWFLINLFQEKFLRAKEFYESDQSVDEISKLIIEQGFDYGGNDG